MVGEDHEVDAPGHSPTPKQPGAILANIAIATSPSFIGRAQELGRLSELLERVEQGRRAVALVGGDAGVGKTRLLTELAERARGRGIRVLVGSCMETGDVGLPYVPFLDAFHGLGASLEDAELVAKLVTAVPSLGRLIPTDGKPSAPMKDDFEQVELFGGVLSLLSRLAEVTPLLVVIEDIHWADRSTRDLLTFLVRSLRAERVALVASYRTDELHRRHPLRPLVGELARVADVERMELPPFTRKIASDHVSHILAKLGVTTRLEAAASAHRSGLDQSSGPEDER